MKVSHLFENHTISFADPDNDPEVIKHLAKAEAEGAAAAEIATPKWEALAKKLKSKHAYIKYKQGHTNLPGLSITVNDDYYINTDGHGGVGISPNRNDSKADFSPEDLTAIKDLVKKSGRQVYGMDYGRRHVHLGYFNSIAEPKWEKMLKAVIKYLQDKSKKAEA